VVDKIIGLDGVLPNSGADILEAHSKSHALLVHHFLPHMFLLYSRCSSKSLSLPFYFFCYLHMSET
jgi:hypothetical protein